MAKGKFFLSEDASDIVSSNQANKSIYGGTENKNEIYQTLDQALTVAKKNARKQQYQKNTGKSAGPWTSPNVLIVGPAGCGKTETVMQWAKDRDVKLVFKDIKVFSRDTLASVTAVKLDDNPDNPIGGKAVTLPTKEFDALDLSLAEMEGEKDEQGNIVKKPLVGSVLFLDEYNRAPASVRNALLTLIRNHQLDKVNGAHTFEQLLFVVAAQNPSVEQGGEAFATTDRLDPAELNRFPFKVSVDPDPATTLAWLTDVYTEEMEAFADDPEAKSEAEQKLLAARCFLDPDICHNAVPHFSTAAEILAQNNNQRDTYTPRSLTDLLEVTDGDPARILPYWQKQFGNYQLKELNNVIRALNNGGNADYEPNDNLKTQQTINGGQPDSNPYYSHGQASTTPQTAASRRGNMTNIR